MIGFVAQRLMELEPTFCARCRLWRTQRRRVGTVELCIWKLRRCSYVPAFLKSRRTGVETAGICHQVARGATMMKVACQRAPLRAAMLGFWRIRVAIQLTFPFPARGTSFDASQRSATAEGAHMWCSVPRAQSVNGSQATIVQVGNVQTLIRHAEGRVKDRISRINRPILGGTVLGVH